jgi:tetratricopeptide (TPR) repeat protein
LPPVTLHGKPRRTSVLCYSKAAEFLFSLGLSRFAQFSCKLAVDCNSAATQKASESNMAIDSSPLIRHLLKIVESRSYYFGGDYDSSLEAANDSVSMAVSLEDQVRGWLAVSDIIKSRIKFDRIDNTLFSNYVDSLLNAVMITQKDFDNLRSLLPLCYIVSLGKALIHCGRHSEAIKIGMFGSQLYPFSSGCYLIAGASFLRIRQYKSAENALLEANILDNRNPDVWAYLSLLLMSNGLNRIEDAVDSLNQALRLKFDNTSILRELATMLMSIDRLPLAEDIFRRTIAIESSTSEAGRGHPYTRKLLADVLSGQNKAVVAIEEYQSVIGDEAADTDTKLAACDACLKLLPTLGRVEEIATIVAIMNSLKL